LRQFGNPSSSLLGTINAIYEIGCFGGAVTVFIFGDMLGRRKCLYVGAALMTIGAILQASSFGVAQMIVGRIVWYVNCELSLCTLA
jgi:MFS family permease